MHPQLAGITIEECLWKYHLENDLLDDWSDYKGDGLTIPLLCSRLSANNSTTKTSVRDGPEPRRRLDEVSVLSVGTRWWWVYPVPKCRCKPDKQNLFVWWTWVASMWVPVLIVLEEDGGSRFLVGPSSKDHQTLPYPLDWPVWNVPGWRPGPNGNIGAFSRALIDGTSSLVSSQTVGVVLRGSVGWRRGRYPVHNPDKHPHHHSLPSRVVQDLVSRSTTSPSLRFQSEMSCRLGSTSLTRPPFGKMSVHGCCVSTSVSTTPEPQCFRWCVCKVSTHLPPKTPSGLKEGQQCIFRTEVEWS